MAPGTEHLKLAASLPNTGTFEEKYMKKSDRFLVEEKIIVEKN